jgi:hypothetical protein
MRLENVKRGNRWPNRAFVWLVGKMEKQPAPDVVRTINYRSGFWGAPWSAALQEVMRGPSDWSIGERELFAAYTSYLNQCPF